MTQFLDIAAIERRGPHPLPWARRALRKLLLQASLRALRLAARLERAPAIAKERPLPLATYERRKGGLIFIEAACLLALAAYFAIGLIAIFIA